MESGADVGFSEKPNYPPGEPAGFVYKPTHTVSKNQYCTSNQFLVTGLTCVGQSELGVSSPFSERFLTKSLQSRSNSVYSEMIKPFDEGVRAS